MEKTHYHLRKADAKDAAAIWELLQAAILRRKNDGSSQWQDGYPNPDTVAQDIEKEIGYVLVEDEEVLGYAAVLKNDEPAYEAIEGTWLTHGDFLVVHRVAISEKAVGKGLAQKLFLKIEDLAKTLNVPSIKVDTNFDNLAMLHILKKLNYTYCGEVHFRGSARKAFEKVLNNTV